MYKQAILAAVLRLGECSTLQILAEVGGSISTARAGGAGRRDYKNKPRTKARLLLTDRGRRRLVTDCLGRLAREGKIRRVSKGIYAPPQIKLFKAV